LDSNDLPSNENKKFHCYCGIYNEEKKATIIDFVEEKLNERQTVL